MKQAVFAFVFVFFVLGLNFSVSAHDKIITEDVEELKTIYAKLDEAAKSADLKMFETYLGENFRLETAEENLNKQQTLVRMRSQFAMVSEITEAVSTITEIKVIDDNYVLNVTFVLIGELVALNGRSVKFTITSKSTDIWHKDRSGNWQEHRQIDLGNTIEIESKRINLA